MNIYRIVDVSSPIPGEVRESEKVKSTSFNLKNPDFAF